MLESIDSCLSLILGICTHLRKTYGHTGETLWNKRSGVESRLVSLQVVLLWARRVVVAIPCGMDHSLCQKALKTGCFRQSTPFVKSTSINTDDKRAIIVPSTHIRCLKNLLINNVNSCKLKLNYTAFAHKLISFGFHMKVTIKEPKELIQPHTTRGKQKQKGIKISLNLTSMACGCRNNLSTNKSISLYDFTQSYHNLAPSND